LRGRAVCRKRGKIAAELEASVTALEKPDRAAEENRPPG
jgi:hypothetical protein